MLGAGCLGVATTPKDASEKQLQLRRSDKPTMKHRQTICALALLLVSILPTTAAADVTAFLGFSPKPATRSVAGFAVGVSLVIVGFEFEYASTSENPEELAPRLRTGMINGLIQTPTRTQFYLTAGGGFYREALEETIRYPLRDEHRRRHEDAAGRTASAAHRLSRRSTYAAAPSTIGRIGFTPGRTFRSKSRRSPFPVPDSGSQSQERGTRNGEQGTATAVCSAPFAPRARCRRGAARTGRTARPAHLHSEP